MNDIDDALRILDPARAADPDAHRRPAARAMLERVLAAPDLTSAVPHATVGRPLHRGRRTAIRGSAALGAVAAAVFAVVVLPNLGGSAVAWTAVPEAVPDARAITMTEQCLEEWVGRSGLTSGDVAAARTVIAEHRGQRDLVVARAGDWVVHCLHDEDGLGIGGIVPASVDVPSTDAEAVTLISSATYLEDDVEPRDREHLQVYFGVVGADVVSLTFHPDGVEPVTATVTSGRFAAFWPVAAIDASSTPQGVPATVVLRSGRVREVTL